MRFLRYIWSLMLFIAATLAPNVATAATLVVAALITICLAVTREKRLRHLVDELSELLSIQHNRSTALDRSLTKLWRHVLVLAATSELVILLALVSNHLDITVARNYCLLVLVALAPLGLEAELAVLVRTKRSHSSETVRTAIGYATEDAHALLAVIGLSFMGTLCLHIPPALSALQILFITCIARPLLSGRALQALPHKVDQRWRVLFASLITYGSFIFFFIRHYLEPRYADSINAVTWQATTVAWLVFMSCQAALPVFNPKAPRTAIWRGGALLALALIAAYVPPINRYIMAHGIAASDWAWIIIADLLFVALVLLRQGMALHSRKAVVNLHRSKA